MYNTFVLNKRTKLYSVHNCNIFTIKNKIPQKVSTFSFKSGMSKGVESEAYAELFKKGFLSKKSKKDFMEKNGYSTENPFCRNGCFIKH